MNSKNILKGNTSLAIMGLVLLVVIIAATFYGAYVNSGIGDPTVAGTETTVPAESAGGFTEPTGAIDSVTPTETTEPLETIAPVVDSEHSTDPSEMDPSVTAPAGAETIPTVPQPTETPETEPVMTEPTSTDPTPTEPAETESIPTEQVPVHVHSYKPEVIEATCKAGGYTTYSCDCGNSYVSDHTQSIPHSFGSWEIVKEPTATDYGEMTRICKGCGETETETVDKKASVNLSDIAPTDLFAGISDKCKPIAEAIVQAVEENYGKPHDGKNTEIVVYGCHDLTNDEHYELISYLCLYYGTFYEPWDFVTVYNGVYEKVTIDLEVACQVEENRRAMMEDIEQAIMTFSVGTEEELVKQAYTYIADTLSYDGYQEAAADAIKTGRGSCNAYCALLRLMLHRLGIDSDVCTGYTASGAYHAWNRVNFADGQCKYYDLTFYEASKNAKYLGATTSFHSIRLVNCYIV